MARSRSLLSVLFALAAPFLLAATAGCASDIGLTGVGDAFAQEPDATQQAGQDGQAPPQDGQMPPDEGQMPPGGEGGPAPCDLDADCDASCPPDAIGCVCAENPEGMTMCVPECDVDADCPAPPGLTLVCDSIEAICVPSGV